MSNQEFAELRWENGQLGMHELGGIIPCAAAKASTWDTLESVVHQATICNKESHYGSQQQVGSSGGVKKRTRSDSDYRSIPRKLHSAVDQWADPSACGSANATFCRDNDTTMMTWPASYESSRTKTTDEDSACNAGSENQEEGKTAKCDTERSHSIRKGRAAAVHNQSERRRRDRINQKMKALQKLVPNASKTDKASMLDEVIDYLKQLQAQVQMMSARNIMMPLGMQQQQLQMAMLARAGMGMMNMSNVAYTSPAQQHLASFVHPVATNTSAFISHPLVIPPVVSSSAPQQATPDQGTSTLAPLSDPYSTFLSQPMSMEMYHRMAALYRQQMDRSAKTSSHMQLNPLQGG